MSKNPRVSNGSRYRKLRDWVFATQAICAICGHPVDKTLKWYIDPKDGKRKLHPMSGEVDHKIPVSKGGKLYSRDNAQLVHRLCNQTKGNGKKKQNIQKSLPLPHSREW